MSIKIKNKELDPNWIKSKDGLCKDAVKYTELLGEHLVDKEKKKGNPMTTSQVRNFFGEVRRIQMKGIKKNKAAFYMLKPKLAYAAARAGQHNKINDFKEIIFELLDAINLNDENSEKQYNNFVNFLEATVAFHKANGGK